jgi:hypothetical protein
MSIIQIAQYSEYEYVQWGSVNRTSLVFEWSYARPFYYKECSFYDRLLTKRSSLAVKKGLVQFLNGKNKMAVV